MKTLLGSSRLRALALNCSSVSWGKGKAEVEAMNKTRREVEEVRHLWQPSVSKLF